MAAATGRPVVWTANRLEGTRRETARHDESGGEMELLGWDSTPRHGRRWTLPVRRGLVRWPGTAVHAVSGGTSTASATPTATLPQLAIVVADGTRCSAGRDALWDDWWDDRWSDRPCGSRCRRGLPPVVLLSGQRSALGNCSNRRDLEGPRRLATPAGRDTVAPDGRSVGPRPATARSPNPFTPTDGDRYRTTSATARPPR